MILEKRTVFGYRRMKFFYLILLFVLSVCACTSNNLTTKPAVEQAPATDLVVEQPKVTDITPVLNTPIVKGRNLIYCASMQLAWNEMSRAFKSPVLLEGNKVPPYSKDLNNTQLLGQVSIDEYIVASGSPKQINQKIAKEMEAKFQTTPTYMFDEKHEFAIYAYLEKQLPFNHPFKESSFVFDKKIRVKSFCSDNERPEVIAQCALLMYAFTNKRNLNKNEFIIRVTPKNENEEIILASVRPAQTLLKTFQKVETWVEKGTFKEGFIQPANGKTEYFNFPIQLSYGHYIDIPKFNFRYEHEFLDLKGITIKNNGTTIREARQSIKFAMNESGAEVFSGFATVADSVGTEDVRFEIPNLIFSKPFLLYLKEKKSKQPYLVIWIDNASILIPANEPSN